MPETSSCSTPSKNSATGTRCIWATIYSNSRRYRKSDKEMHRLVGYFKRHRKRTDYPRFTRRSHAIGSGVIESICKNVVQMRLKGPGMRWREDNACAVATLRGALLSGHWNDFFARRSVA